jgi:hypothetical protein
MNKFRITPIVVTGAMLSGLTVIEDREKYHIEQKLYEGLPTLTYENPMSTATATVMPLLFGRLDQFT